MQRNRGKNRIGNTRNLFKKIRDTKGTFHAKVGTIKDRNDMDLEENNRMGKTRDLFKKIRDTKGTFHAKIGSIKDRNDMDLTEAEDIKKRW